MRLELLSRWLIIAAAALVPATAAGQAVPVISPPSPTIPSMNVRRAAGLPTLTRTAPAAKVAKGPVTGYSGGDMVVPDDDDAALYGGKSRSSGARRRYKGGQVPEFHVVRNGDTMWEICDYYYGDPWGWPQLWSHNKSITNPHWIYPGDRVRLLGGQGKRGGRMSVLSSGGLRQYDAGPVQLRQNAFVDPKEMKKAGKIVGSKQERKMLTSFQEIYIKGGGDFKPRAGGVYTIYRVKRPLNSKKNKKIGNIVEILGSARVKRVNSDGVATATIISAFNEINRGDSVGPLRRTFKRLPVRPARQNLEGHMRQQDVPRGGRGRGLRARRPRQRLRRPRHPLGQGAARRRQAPDAPRVLIEENWVIRDRKPETGNFLFPVSCF